MTRTDIHKPSSVIPEDYDFVCVQYHGKAGEWMGTMNGIAMEEFRAHMAAHSGAKFSGHNHGGSCHICGAHAASLATYYHAKSNRYIHTGLDCAEKMDIADASAFRAFRRGVARARKDQKHALQLKAGKAKAEAILAQEGMPHAWTIYSQRNEPTPVLENAPDFLSSKFAHLHSVVDDLICTLIRRGSLSDKMANYLRSLLAQIDEMPQRVAKHNEEQKDNKPAPEGRQTIKGEVLARKEGDPDGQWGPEPDKLLIQCDGFRVWCSLPSAIWWTQKGEQVEFAITLKRSDKDQSFAFGKRPAKARNLTIVSEEAWRAADEKAYREKVEAEEKAEAEAEKQTAPAFGDYANQQLALF